MATSTTKRTTALSKTVPGKKPTSAMAKPPVKPAQEPASKPVVSPKLVSMSDPVVGQVDLKKKELIDLVVERSNIKKKDAKPVVEAMLAVLGETIASGRELNLQPLGKLRINRSTDKGNGQVIICKLRQSNAAKNAANAPLAETSDKL